MVATPVVVPTTVQLAIRILQQPPVPAPIQAQNRRPTGHDTGDSDEISASDSSNESETNDTNDTTGVDTEDDDTPCVPNTTRCLNAKKIQFCGPLGTWEPPQDCIDQACIVDRCAGDCFPESTKCLNPAEIQTCSNQGQWGNAKVCTNQTCLEDECQGECAPAQVRCNGLEIQSCATSGQWMTDEVCNEPDQVCKNGECVVGCKPWTRQFGTSGTDISNAIAVDSTGNIYIVGETRGVLESNAPAGESDGFVIKCDSKGLIVWQRQFGSTDIDIANDVAIGPSGEVYITGRTDKDYGDDDDDDDDDDGDVTGRWVSDGFVAKYDAKGQKQWWQEFGVVKREDYGAGIAVDNNSTVYVTGSSKGNLDDAELIGHGSAFIRKYISDSTYQWTSYLSENESKGFGVATTNLGTTYITGREFLAKYSPEGIEKWSTPFNITSWGKGHGVSISKTGMIYVTGESFLGKFNTQGLQIWTQKFGTKVGKNRSRGIAIDSKGHIYITGNTYEHLDGNHSSGEWDAFVIKYNQESKRLWTKQLGTDASDFGTGIAITEDDQIYITGYTEGKFEENTASGSSDIFISHICDE